MGCGCGLTCWRRLRDWQAAGLWQKLHETLLAELHRAGQLEIAAIVADASYLRAFLGAADPAPWTEPKQAPSITSWSTCTARRCPRRDYPPERPDRLHRRKRRLRYKRRLRDSRQWLLHSRR